jgi:hypothetical protein
MRAKSTKPRLSPGLRKLTTKLAFLSFFASVTGKLFWFFERHRSLLADQIEERRMI